MKHQPNPFKDRRSEDLIRELAMKFVAQESNGTSLVTVTNVLLANRGKNVMIFFTVLPEEKEEVVLDFLKRKRPELKDFIKDNSRLGVLPLVDFQIDFGEKNRQTVDRLI
jgi:ribosome-binding factor A